MKYLVINNWCKFQHYKDRNPPWIKLNTDTFQEYHFQCLHDASKLLAICCWTLASKYKDPKKGAIPYDLDYIKRQCNLGDFVQEEHLEELINKGFLQLASSTLAPCKQSARPETETEAYSKEAEKNIKKNSANEMLFEEFWIFYGKIGNKEQARKKFKSAIKKGASYEEITRGVERYHKYFKANGWYDQPQYASTWLNNNGWEQEYKILKSQNETKQTKRERTIDAIKQGEEESRMAY